MLHYFKHRERIVHFQLEIFLSLFLFLRSEDESSSSSSSPSSSLWSVDINYGIFPIIFTIICCLVCIFSDSSSSGRNLHNTPLFTSISSSLLSSSLSSLSFRTEASSLHFIVDASLNTLVLLVASDSEKNNNI